MKGRFLSWAKERLFLIVVVFLYSILAFINLGDFSAPQTFQNFQPGEKFLIVLPEAQKVSNVIFYTGTTKNDFKIHYQVKKPNDCACGNNLDFLNFEDFTKPQEVNIDAAIYMVESRNQASSFNDSDSAKSFARNRNLAKLEF